MQRVRGQRSLDGVSALCSCAAQARLKRTFNQQKLRNTGYRVREIHLIIHIWEIHHARSTKCTFMKAQSTAGWPVKKFLSGKNEAENGTRAKPTPNNCELSNHIKVDRFHRWRCQFFRWLKLKLEGEVEDAVDDRRQGPFFWNRFEPSNYIPDPFLTIFGTSS